MAAINSSSKSRRGPIPSAGCRPGRRDSRIRPAAQAAVASLLLLSCSGGSALRSTSWDIGTAARALGHSESETRAGNAVAAIRELWLYDLGQGTPLYLGSGANLEVTNPSYPAPAVVVLVGTDLPGQFSYQSSSQTVPRTEFIVFPESVKTVPAPPAPIRRTGVPIRLIVSGDIDSISVYDCPAEGLNSSREYSSTPPFQAPEFSIGVGMASYLPSNSTPVIKEPDACQYTPQAVHSPKYPIYRLGANAALTNLGPGDHAQGTNTSAETLALMVVDIASSALLGLEWLEPGESALIPVYGPALAFFGKDADLLPSDFKIY
jgi:hypothetical protein